MSIKKSIILISIIFLLVFVSGCVLQKDKEQSALQDESKQQGEKQVEEKKGFLTTIKDKLQKTPDSEIISLDETWSKYTNYKLGFLIKIPKKIWTISTFNLCKEDDEGRFKKPAARLEVPAKAFEDEDTVYIREEYYYEKSDSNDECKKITNTLSLIKDKDNPSRYSWNIIVRDIKNENELENFIKERFGKGCSINERKTTNQSGVYDITVTSITGETITKDCVFNFIYVIKYYPEKQKAVQWDLGQDCSFSNNSRFSSNIIPTCFDWDMKDSFKFIN